MSGETHRSTAARRSGASDDAGRADSSEESPLLERTAERIAAALRRQPVDDAGEQAAVAAFRSARLAATKPSSGRRQDDWRPRTRRQRWMRGGTAALAATTLLGGVAVASIGVGDAGREAPRAAGGPAPSRTPAPPAGDRGGAPAPAPGTTASSPPRAPSPGAGAGVGPGADIEAHCRAYERVEGRGHALDAPAWQRLVRAAGGAEQVAAYCAGVTDAAGDPGPTGRGEPTKRARPTQAAEPGQADPPGKPDEPGKGDQQAKEKKAKEAKEKSAAADEEAVPQPHH
ncbi:MULTISPECIES: hypothetical protein [unclassified Streptomyces]|uniref:hypothetical protein n=1 Tax=unclassified Streptomyces TaxID=2593676 RepID=UPI003D7568C7